MPQYLMHLRKVRVRNWVLLFVLLLGGFYVTKPAEPVGVVTFNIQNYPKSAEQSSQAFSAIAETRASIIAVQEIMDVAHFQRAAHAALGTSWTFLVPIRATDRHVGILFDADRVELLSARTIFATQTYPGARPAFEARFRIPNRARTLRVITLHLKAGGDHFARRRVQLLALEPELRDTGEGLVLLGDFNSTGLDDLTLIEELALRYDLFWATKAVPCTHFWDRSTECLPTTLDHILMSYAPNQPAQAYGPCASSCKRAASCPVFASDHCPVLVDL